MSIDVVALERGPFGQHLEGMAVRLLRSAGKTCDHINRMIPLFHHEPGCLHPKVLDSLGWCQAITAHAALCDAVRPYRGASRDHIVF